jgi:hypothetical protein
MSEAAECSATQEFGRRLSLHLGPEAKNVITNVFSFYSGVGRRVLARDDGDAAELNRPYEHGLAPARMG